VRGWFMVPMRAQSDRTLPVKLECKSRLSSLLVQATFHSLGPTACRKARRNRSQERLRCALAPERKV